MKLALVGCIASSALLAGCLSPVDITTAYQAEEYLCGDDEAYAARVAECRARRESGEGCSGVFSFEGVIGGVDVVVDTDLDEVITTSIRFADLTLARDNVELFGDSPYFSFVVSLGSLGGPDSRPDGDEIQDLARSPECEDGTVDGEVKLSFRIVAAGSSTDDDLQMGTITMSRQTADEHEGRFVGTFRDGSPLTGCFMAFTDLAIVEQADVCN